MTATRALAFYSKTSPWAEMLNHTPGGDTTMGTYTIKPIAYNNAYGVAY
jgi:hypothetical protein